MWRNVAILVVALLAACAGATSSTGEGESSRVEESYDLTTRIHTASAQLPGGYDEALRALEDLKEDPAGTLIYVLKQTNPAAAAVLDFLPGALEGKFKEWVNEYIFARVFDGLPATEQFGELANQAAAMLDVLELATRLDGHGEGSHELIGIAFAVYGESLLVETDAVGIEQEIVTHGVEVTRDGDGLAVGAHGLDIPAGPYAVFALDMALRLKFGTDLEGLIAQAIACETLAQEISDKCYLSVCVGHEAELLQFCTDAAAAMADYVQDRIRDLAIEAELQSGTALLSENEVQDGVWDMQLNMGQGDMAPEATFTGYKID